MGVIRKSMSMMTLGLIDFRSDKERIARSSRQTAQELKRQNQLLWAQNHRRGRGHV